MEAPSGENEKQFLCTKTVQYLGGIHHLDFYFTSLYVIC